MPFLVRNIRLGLDDPEDALVDAVADRLNVPRAAVRTYAVVRRSVDARKKDVHFSYQIEVALNESEEKQRERLKQMNPSEAVWIERRTPESIQFGTTPLRHRPVVIGFGPAGMLSALRLAEHGYRPLVLERGRAVRRRHRDILQRFYRDHEFDDSSNLLFGEGGAGTYSDGKLYTRVNDALCRQVLEAFYHHGADPDILVDTRPHIGSDRLPTICTRLRERIEQLGGEVRFESHVDDVRIDDGKLTAIRVASTDAKRQPEWLDVDAVLLAIGHSARDTIRLLHERGVRISPKPFQIGVRIEHPQAMVNRWQYGAAADHRRLGAAEYHLVAKGVAGEAGDMFSFCMCPGGQILPTNESHGLIATNGASRATRKSPFANSGLVITIDPRTLTDSAATPSSPADEARLALEAVAYQAKWERKAFEATKETYQVPAQRAADFLDGRASDGTLETSYPLGGMWTHIADVIPPSVAQSLRQALPTLDRKFPGFAGPDAIITGPETRASSPVRILRDPITRQAVETAQLYPVGEGAGYAGGIISAAVDGIKSAEAIMTAYAPPE